MKAVRVGCMNIGSSEDSDFEDSVKAFVFIDLAKKFDGPLRYIVQWKQRAMVRGKVEETDWITASVSVLQKKVLFFLTKINC